jgi:hypothetical protein
VVIVALGVVVMVAAAVGTGALVSVARAIVVVRA